MVFLGKEGRTLFQLWPEKQQFSEKNADSVKPPGRRRRVLFSHQTPPVRGGVGAGEDSMQQAWVGLVLSIKADGRGQGTSAQGQGDQPLALPFSLGLLAIFCCLSWPPAWSRDFTSLPAPVLWGLEATAMAGRRVWLIRRYQEKWQEMRVGSWPPWPGRRSGWLHLLSRPHNPCVIFEGPHSSPKSVVTSTLPAPQDSSRTNCWRLWTFVSPPKPGLQGQQGQARKQVASLLFYRRCWAKGKYYPLPLRLPRSGPT